MDGLPSPGATATASSISATAGGSAIRTISFEAYLILGSFGPSIFPAFSPKIILMGWWILLINFGFKISAFGFKLLNSHAILLKSTQIFLYSWLLFFK